MTVVWVIFVFIGIAATALVVNAIEDYNSTIKFKIQNTLQNVGVPIIALYNNNKRFNFLIDSGANLSLIDSNILDEIECDYLDNTGTMYGVGGKIIKVTYIKMSLFIEDSIFTEDFQVTDLTPTFHRIEEKNGVKIHGILGNSFFEKYSGIINYSKYIFYLNKKNGKKNRSSK